MSKLEFKVNSLLNHMLSQTNIVLRNYRPTWLKGFEGKNLELDFYIPKLGIAIEVQGEQHTRFIEYFHGDYENFQKQVDRDVLKKEKCIYNSIELIEIFNEADLEKIVKIITKRISKGTRGLPFRKQLLKFTFNYEHIGQEVSNELKILLREKKTATAWVGALDYRIKELERLVKQIKADRKEVMLAQLEKKLLDINN